MNPGVNLEASHELKELIFLVYKWQKKMKILNLLFLLYLLRFLELYLSTPKENDSLLRDRLWVSESTGAWLA